MTCDHQRRLWLITPGIWRPALFGYCDDCGARLSAEEMDALVLARYAPAEEPEATRQGIADRWLIFLYPSGVVSALRRGDYDAACASHL